VRQGRGVRWLAQTGEPTARRNTSTFLGLRSRGQNADRRAASLATAGRAQKTKLSAPLFPPILVLFLSSSNQQPDTCAVERSRHPISTQSTKKSNPFSPPSAMSKRRQPEAETPDTSSSDDTATVWDEQCKVRLEAGWLREGADLFRSSRFSLPSALSFNVRNPERLSNYLTRFIGGTVRGRGSGGPGLAARSAPPGNRKPVSSSAAATRCVFAQAWTVVDTRSGCCRRHSWHRPCVNAHRR